MLRTLCELPEADGRARARRLLRRRRRPGRGVRHRGRRATACSFCLSEAKLGLIPATISPYVVRAIGEQAARRYFLTAERFDAADAYRIGLVHEVVAPDALDAKVDEIVAALAANGPAALRACKQLVQDVASRPHRRARCAPTPRGASPTSAPATKAAKACGAFLDKRAPSWLLGRP